MVYSTALKILLNKKILKNPKIIKLSAGNNYQSFLVDDGDFKYVLRLLNKRASAKDRLEKAYFILKFVESEGFFFSEKAVFFDKKNSFLLSTYINGKESSIHDLSSQQLIDFVKKIVSLRSASFDKFIILQKKEKINFDILENPIDRLFFLKKERIKYIKKNKEILIKNEINFSQLLDWINVNFIFLQDFYKSKKYKKGEIFFDHGDVAGANIISNRDGLFFIDWDNAKFTQDIGFSLANTFFYSGDFSKKFIDKFLLLYFREAGVKLNKKIFLEELRLGFKLIIFSGVLWALDSFIRSKKSKKDDCKRYLDLYKQRLKTYNNFLIK